MTGSVDARMRRSGRGVASLWSAQGVAVFGLARSRETAARLSRHGIVPGTITEYFYAVADRLGLPRPCSKTKAEEDGMAEHEKVTLIVTGMTCNHCVMATRKSLASVPGVADVAVTLDPPRAVVTYDPEKAGVDRLAAAVRDAGYAASEAPCGVGG